MEFVRREDQLSALVLSGRTQETAEEFLRELLVERVLQLVDEEHPLTVLLSRPVEDGKQVEVPNGAVRLLVEGQFEVLVPVPVLGHEPLIGDFPALLPPHAEDYPFTTDAR